MLVNEFDYQLPEASIAQAPLKDRAASRMLVVHRAEKRWEDRMFRELPAFLGPGDCLALNDSKVFPSRLLGHREGRTGVVEVFLLRALSEDQLTWRALVRPGRKMRSGDRVQFGAMAATILGRGEFGERTLRFDERAGDFWEALQLSGHVPLPPYIKRADTVEDRERYQTVYARERGSVAAPTAGLHFTPGVLQECQDAGAAIAHVTLHVGLGTFQPLHTDHVEAVELHSEEFHIAPGELAKMRAARRLVCVGTTSVRAAESAWRGEEGETRIFIYPGFEFQAAGALLTNFHLPQSSLLMLVCAFGGRELTLNAYRHAVAAGYRLYSYGDCMLVL